MKTPLLFDTARLNEIFDHKGSRGDNLKKVAVIIRPQDLAESGPWGDPEVDEGVFKKTLVARDQDPFTIIIPFLPVT